MVFWLNVRGIQSPIALEFTENLNLTEEHPDAHAIKFAFKLSAVDGGHLLVFCFLWCVLSYLDGTIL